MIAPFHQVEIFLISALNRKHNRYTSKWIQENRMREEVLRTKENDKKNNTKRDRKYKRQQVRVSVQDLWF